MKKLKELIESSTCFEEYKAKEEDAYWVYVLYHLEYEKAYVGFTANYIQRRKAHINGIRHYPDNSVNIYFQGCNTDEIKFNIIEGFPKEKDALAYERAVTESVGLEFLINRVHGGIKPNGKGWSREACIKGGKTKKRKSR